MKSFVVNGLTALNISGCEIRLAYSMFSIGGYTQNRNYYQFFEDVHFSEWRDLAGASHPWRASMYWISYSLRLPWELLLQALYGKYIKYNINIIFIHVRVYRDFTKNSLTDNAAGIVIQSLNQVWCNRKQAYSHPAISPTF